LRRTDVRLITLTGTGGTGKTRLALQVAAELLDEYAHGVFFVALAPISDPDLIVTTIAQVLGIKEVGGQSPLASLKEYLRDRQMLLVLDNFEQIVIAAPLVAELLEVARNLNILVTSRMRLSLYGEREFAVPPLIFPHQSRLPSLEHVMRYEAVRLFVERAQTVEVEFVITAENAQAVVEICSRLDGLPLAIELAAARSKILSPQAILARLDRRFKLLTGGARNLPPRQQTLRSAIDWSFDLLNLEEQKLFARLGVFVGGCTIEAVEAVCAMPNGQEIDVFDGLISLVDKSLLRRQDGAEGEPRFVMLETIREYAHDRLAEQGEAAALRSRHATHYLAIAEQAEPKIHGTQQIAALEQLEAEHDNLRAALAWFLEDAAEMGVRLAGSLWWFWYYHGHYSEGLRWLAQAMTKTAPLGTTQPRAKVYIGAAMLAYYRGDLTQAKIFCETGMEMAQVVGDRWYAALARNTLGTILRTHRDYAAAEVLYEQGLSLARDIGDEWLAALALGNLGILAFHQDDCRRAAVYCSDSVARFRAVHDYWYTAGMLNILARVMESTNDDRQAAMLHLESLALFRDLGNQWGIALCLAGLAGVAGAQGQPERAARLLGAAEALWEAIGEPLFPTIRADHDRIVASVHAALSAEVFVALWAQGRNMPIKQAIAYAVAADV